MLNCAVDSETVGALPVDEVQHLFAATIRTFSALRQAAEADAKPGPFPPAAQVTATDASIAALAILRACEIEVFELGLWQSMAGDI